MFKKILLPLDLTDKHAPVLQQASELAAKNGGEIVLLHVVELIPGLAEGEERDFYARLEKAAHTHLTNLGKSLTPHKITWSAKVVLGNRAQEIARQADVVGADLIILIAPRISLDSPDGWGSLSYKVGLLAKCPVLLVK